MRSERPYSNIAKYAVRFAFFIPPLGLILGIVGAAILSDDGPKRGRGIAMWSIVISLFVMLVGGPLMILKMNRFNCGARQAEAKMYLRQVLRLQKAYYEKHKAYGTLDDIGFTYRKDYPRRYDVALRRLGHRDFMAEAISNERLIINDAWTIDQNRSFNNTIRGCH